MNTPLTDLSQTKTIKELLKTNYIRVSESFCRELELSFTDIDTKIVNKIINKMNKKESFFIKVITDTVNYLEDFSKFFTESKNKRDFDFMNDLVFFNIDFSIFAKENTNTKKTIVNYLLQLYVTAYMYINEKYPTHINKNNKISSDIDQVENFFGLDQTFLEQINLSLPPGLDGLLGGTDIIAKATELVKEGNPIFEMLKNKDMMDMAKEVSKDISKMNINPMAMLSSIMSGGSVPQETTDLLTKISSKIANKLENSNIDKEALETQAKDFMKNFKM